MTTFRLTPQQGCAVAARRWLSAVIFCVFLLAGCVFLLVAFQTTVLVPWRVSNRYQETTCVVLAGRIDLQALGGNDPEGGDVIGDGWSYRPEFLIQYEVNGQNYQTWTYDSPPRWGSRYYGGRPDAQAALDKFTVGHVYPCWYDPDEPGQAILVRGHGPFFLWLCFPWLFILFGGFGLIWLVRTRKARSRREPA